MVDKSLDTRSYIRDDLLKRIPQDGPLVSELSLFLRDFRFSE